MQGIDRLDMLYLNVDLEKGVEFDLLRNCVKIP